tara:strand:+ start:220 stop:516 length:297 start_codon:yes stop_codon:yes gene_type:complete
MNLKKNLVKMNLSDLRSVCKELGISCPNAKNSIINKLLEPLNKKFRFTDCNDKLKKMEWDGWKTNKQWEDHVKETIRICGGKKTCDKIIELGVNSIHC